MSEKLCPLYDLCLLKVVHLIRHSYWCEDQNPFTLLPSSIVNQLFKEAIKENWSMKYSDLKLLLLSNRLSEVIIFKIYMTNSIFCRFLMDLSTACDSLKIIKIHNMSSIDESSNMRDALHTLLRKAQNIEVIESEVMFDLSVLRNLTHLKKLVFSFCLKNNLLDMMNGENLKSLKHLEISHHQFSKIIKNGMTYLDIATILKHCPDLVHFNWDISLSLLEIYNKNQPIERNFNDKFNLQYCILGSAKSYASEESIQLAALTCPYINDLSIFPNTCDSINALRKLHFLTKLDLHLSPDSAHISSTFWSVLKETNIGYNLKIIILRYFKYANFTVLGKCSPKLEELHVCYSEDISAKDYSSTFFNKLRILIMKKMNDFYDPLSYGYCKANTLVGIMSNAPNLVFARISAAGELTDEIMQKILEKNSFDKLEGFQFIHCNLPWDVPWDVIGKLGTKASVLRKLKKKNPIYVDYLNYL